MPAADSPSSMGSHILMAVVFAAGLTAVGVWIGSHEVLDLPTKHPPKVYRLAGWRVSCLALTPLLWAATMMLCGRRWYVTGQLPSGETITGLEMGLFFGAIACVLFALLNAPLVG